MTQIELFINGKPCDIQNPSKLGVRLNRVLINPSELNTKDAQYSYSITLPSTRQNDAIFGYANVEEVKNKFNVDYSALLIVDGVIIFDGKFRMSEITDKIYKGNLILPAQKTVKDIFGDKKMNALDGTWNIDFYNMVEGLNAANTDKGIPDCIFPFVLYGLLPKVPKNVEGTEYTAKTLWDEYVRLGLQDFPPSVNCMKTISKIFRSKNYNIEGNAFDDERLTNLYMSYHNPPGYAQPWHWGRLGEMVVKGKWTNRKTDNDNNEIAREKYYFENEIERKVYVANLLDSSTTEITHITDAGANILYSVVEDTENPKEKGRRCQTVITVPFSGLYKVTLKVDMKLDDDNNQDYGGTPKIISSRFDKAYNDFDNRAHEVKLLRDYGEGGFGLDSVSMDASYYKPNMPQNQNWEQYDGDGEVENEIDFPKYYPVPGEQCVQFIDPCVNEKLLSGFRWGNFKGSDDRFPVREFKAAGKGEGLSDKDYLGRIMAIKHGWSWDNKFSQKDKIYSVVNNMTKISSESTPIGKEELGYWMYGRPEEEIENEEEVKNTYGWYPSPKYGTVLQNTDINFANKINTGDNLRAGSGVLSQVVWLNKGEHITLVTASDAGVARKHRASKGPYGWMRQDVDFEISLRPFMKKPEWIKIDNQGTGIDDMDWEGESDFGTEKLDLFKFLPSEVKVDEWLDNFCKAFNLQIVQKDKTNFELNIKQNQDRISYAILDISDKASVLHRNNLPLGLPAMYKLGFKINEEEKGYCGAEIDNVTGPNDPLATKDDGGGFFETGTIDGTTVDQVSSFSYNWFKKIKKDEQNLFFPIITEYKIWDSGTLNYSEMQQKLYTHYGQRFWYKTGETYNLGRLWKKKGLDNSEPDKELDLQVPVLSDVYNGNPSLCLNYKDEANSIMNAYFSIVASNDSNYTEIECYLSPDEYDRMDGNMLVKFNDDLYYIATVEGYDPLNINKAKIRLIRKL